MRKLSVLLFVVLLCSCTSETRKGEEDWKKPVRLKTTVKVENRNFLDMTVYLLNASERWRLGVVRGLNSRVFTIPEDIAYTVRSIRFLADPVGSGQQPVSQEIQVTPGDEIEMVIP